MWPVIGGLLSGGMSALGSIFGTQENNANQQQMQLQAEQFNSQQVQQQENFQQQMSSTAYQRASQDMTAAGLNPAMMFSSGSAASTPSGAMTSVQPVQKSSALPAIGDSVGKAVNTAVALKTADATIDNLIKDNARIAADTSLKDSQSRNVSVDSGLKAEQAGNQRAQTEESIARRNNIIATLPSVQNAAVTAGNEMSIDPTTRKLADQMGYGGRKLDDVLSPVGNVISSAKQWHSMMPRRSTQETTRSDDGSSTFTERWDGL